MFDNTITLSLFWMMRMMVFFSCPYIVIALSKFQFKWNDHLSNQQTNEKKENYSVFFRIEFSFFLNSDVGYDDDDDHCFLKNFSNPIRNRMFIFLVKKNVSFINLVTLCYHILIKQKWNWIDQKPKTKIGEKQKLSKYKYKHNQFMMIMMIWMVEKIGEKTKQNKLWYNVSK